MSFDRVYVVYYQVFVSINFSACIHFHCVVDVKVRDLVWNPAQNGCIAVLLTNGDLSIVDLQGTNAFVQEIKGSAITASKYSCTNFTILAFIHIKRS